MVIVRLLINAAALAAATFLLSGISLQTDSTSKQVITLLVVALIFGLINALIKPVFKFVTAPLIFLTLGLFLLVINALLLMLTSWVSGLFGQPWHVDGFWTAVLGSLIVSVVSYLLGMFLPDRDRARARRR